MGNLKSIVTDILLKIFSFSKTIIQSKNPTKAKFYCCLQKKMGGEKKFAFAVASSILFCF